MIISISWGRVRSWRFKIGSFIFIYFFFHKIGLHYYHYDLMNKDIIYILLVQQPFQLFSAFGGGFRGRKYFNSYKLFHHFRWIKLIINRWFGGQINGVFTKTPLTGLRVAYTIRKSVNGVFVKSLNLWISNAI